MERYLSKASVRPEIAKKRHTAPGGIDTGTRRRSGSRLEQCPLCGRSFHIKQIISHAATCTGSPAVPVVAAFGSTGGSAPATTSDSVASSSTIAVSGQRCSTTTGTVVAKKQESIVSLLSREDPGAVRPPSCLMLPQLETPALPGQYLVPNFITKAEEADLLAFLDCPTTQPPWKPSTFNGRHLGRRWGVGTRLGCGGHPSEQTECFTPPLHSMPPLLVRLVKRMRATVSLLRSFAPNEANAIDYHRKLHHFLALHCDDRRLSGKILVNLSLAGDARMRYTEDRLGTNESFAGAETGSAKSVLVMLPRRSIQVQTGRVRYSFKHGIAKEDFLDDRRVSITFRQNRFEGFNV